ncbi:MAG TPA: hypothetical protein VNS09_22755 [Solirubrobacter sp.]|nr:hypothetical protein [Solirubrobacter sp.]
MTTSLRPLSIGEILDAGIKVVTRHWKPLMACIVGLTAPVWVLYILILASIDPDLLDANSGLDSTSTSSTPDDTAAFVGVFLSVVLLAVTFLIAFTACFKAVSDAWLGADVSIKRSLRFGVRRSPRLLLLAIVSGFAISVGFVACLVPGVYLSVLWCLCFPALLFERIGVFKAMGRSGKLISGRWWGSFLLVLVGYILVSVIGFVIQLALVAVAALVAADSVVASSIAQVIGSTLSSAISYPYLAAILTILYFDQRVRKEGFDLQLEAEGFTPGAPVPAPLIGDDVVYTPEQRAAAPYWPPPPGWTPPPAEPEWSSSSGWQAPSAPPEPEDPLPPSQPPPGWPRKDDEDDGKRADWLPPEAPRGPGGL